MPAKILQSGNALLRSIAKEVPISEIRTAKIKKIISDMGKALASQDDGVAIAAPQIGVPLCIFVVSGKVLAYIKSEEWNNETAKKYNDLIFINPVITKSSKKKKGMEEGCLSVRYLYGKVKRAAKVTLMAYNEKGVKITRGASDLMAQVFQHETDHLEGILFTDMATDLKEISPEELKKRARSHP